MNNTQPTPDAPLPRHTACPGLLRIVQARDGGICRVKLPGGRLSVAQALAISAAAERHASGVLEITNRANLQIRGVRGGEEEALIDALLAAELGPNNAGADDVRNLMLSPAAGVDAQQRLDVRPLAEQLLMLLESNDTLHRLSAKFALQLDGGESLAMLEHHHDLWISALDKQRFAFGLASVPTEALAAVTAEQVPALVKACLELFLQHASPKHTRMRHLLEQMPIDDFLATLQARLPFALEQTAEVLAWRRPAAEPWAHLGIRAQRQAGWVHIGAAPVLGRISAAQLAAVAHLAHSALYFTPWQSLLLRDVSSAESPALLAKLNALGLLTDSALPLARIVACSGSTDCGKGLAASKSDALLLADLLAGKGTIDQVHLSACTRSCAAAHVAPHTLLAVAEGRYDLYKRDSSSAGFGRLLARNLTITDAADTLTAQPRTMEAP
ncbi:precorrin-3B synthase [Pseudomonas turukhanskensis]|uniref:precorrin-3B synthase n=1 Tax=Pseudomonas turukhanskensis TaxID=1806536 RepID=UPI0022F2D83A|nr:precorrin-3B synthase [Pseudomonas turukhanskensis]